MFSKVTRTRIYSNRLTCRYQFIAGEFCVFIVCAILTGHLPYLYTFSMNPTKKKSLRPGNRLFTVPENIGINLGLWLVLQELKIKLKTGSVFEEPVSFPVFCFELAGDDVGRTRTFFALSDLELHLLAFVKRGIAAHLDF